MAKVKSLPPRALHQHSRPLKPTAVIECAVCWFSHADVRKGANSYHAECLEDMKREFHRPPSRLIDQERSRVP